MSTRSLPGGKGRPARKADNLTAVYEPSVYKMWEPRRLTTLLVSTAYYKDSFTFTQLTFLIFLDISEFHCSVSQVRISPTYNFFFISQFIIHNLQNLQ
jgi:hypothetical protein